MKNLNKKFWAALVLFGLVGQVAWVVENMYLNVFVYKMFHASASDISLMVSVSSVAAALTTILIGASNRGKIEGINAMMPLVAILVVFGGFMGFNLDLVSSWSMIFVIIGGVVILLGAAGLFLIEEVPGKNRENKAHFT